MNQPIFNLYSIEDPANLHHEIIASMAHFQYKHGAIPTIVRVHPDYLDGLGGELEFISQDNHRRYVAQIVPDKRQGMADYMIEGEI